MYLHNYDYNFFFKIHWKRLKNSKRNNKLVLQRKIRISVGDEKEVMLKSEIGEMSIVGKVRKAVNMKNKGIVMEKMNCVKQLVEMYTLYYNRRTRG